MYVSSILLGLQPAAEESKLWKKPINFLRSADIIDYSRKKLFLHFPGIFYHTVKPFLTVKIFFYTGFYKENLKKCVENRSFPKAVWKIKFSTLVFQNQCRKFYFPHWFWKTSVLHTLFQIFLIKTSEEKNLHSEKRLHCMIENAWKM